MRNPFSRSSSLYCIEYSFQFRSTSLFSSSLIDNVVSSVKFDRLNCCLCGASFVVAIYFSRWRSPIVGGAQRCGVNSGYGDSNGKKGTLNQ